MDDKREEVFLFSLVLIFALGLAAIAMFCGMDMMTRLTGFGKFLIIGIPIIIVLVLCWNPLHIFFREGNTNTKTWVTFSKEKENYETAERLLFIDSSFDNETSQSISDLPYLKYVDLDISEWKLPENFFSDCKNIEEVTFFQRPKNNGSSKFQVATFSKCINLRKVNLVGNCSEWKNFEISVPSKCEIVFIPIKTVFIPENAIKQAMSNAVINIQNNVSTKCSEKKESQGEKK